MRESAPIGVRWLVPVLAVIVVLVVALWPRAEEASAPSARSGAGVGAALRDQGELDRLGAQAALRPCPDPVEASGVPGPLGGLLARCLGSSSEVDLGAALAGTSTLINLWASWCGPCRAEIPALEAYATSPGAVRVVGIDIEDDATAALALLTELGAHYPSFGNTDVGALHAALGAPPVLPLSFLLRADGSIERITTPATFENPAQIHQVITELMS